MKNLFSLILFVPLLTQASSLTPTNGIYRCLEGNNDSICDQKLKIRTSQNEISSIEIEYVGDCGSQGPYVYSCDNAKCSDGVIEVSFMNQELYQWKNISYDIHCKMQKLKP